MEKIVIVDDHPVIINGLRVILEESGRYTVTGEALNAEEAMMILNKVSADLMIIDVELGCGLNGIELVKKICKDYPEIRMLVMSMDDGALYAERALKAGAKGFISKVNVADDIFTAIETVKKGQIYLSSEVCNIIAGNYFRNYINPVVDNDMASLTDRELEVFQLIGRGYKRMEIAERLNISVSTFEAHRRKIRKKMSIETSSELIKTAIKHEAERFHIQPLSEPRL